MAAVLCQRFFAVQIQGAHHGQVMEREQASVVRRGAVHVLMEHPGWYAENVAFAPVKAFAIDDGITFTLAHW